ncbi:MAG: HNH endonuclease [Anaerolineae bacterium]|nr:HNH endonuclease [Anaerolineae bacterium]
MKSFVGITDRDWFNLLSSTEGLSEVNFWQPSGRVVFKAISIGELFLFKLHHPENYIVGGGFFAHSTILPISMAWEAFGVANGAITLKDMRARVEKYKKLGVNKFEDYSIGCILLEQPFFLPQERWIPIPSNWSSNIVQGKTYDLTIEPGRSIWNYLQGSIRLPVMVRELQAQYGNPFFTYPRLGQGSFRVIVTDAYDRRCAVTSERTLPALEAAHIKPFAENGPLSVNNGVLLRRDLHALFDRGYLTITPEFKFEVSRKIKEEFENGHEYYQYHGSSIRLPKNKKFYPSVDFLNWHNDSIFRN